MFKKILTALALLAAAVLPTLASGSVAAAAPAVGCYGDYCSGKDPESTGCSADAKTTASAAVGGYTVELRWSPTCKTNWTRIQAGYGGSLWTVQSTGYKQGASTGNGSYRWTKMIYSPSYLCRGEAGNTYTNWA